MTACYERSGIHFLYPENWRVTDEQPLEAPLSVTVQSPESGFWSLMVYDSGVEPRKLVEQVLKSMRGEYDGLESRVIAERFGEVQSLGYEMCFYCLDFVVNARTMATRAMGKTLLLLWQAEDREFDQLEPVFRAMTLSLFQDAATPPHTHAASRKSGRTRENLP